MANIDSLRYAKGSVKTADLRLTMQKVCKTLNERTGPRVACSKHC